MDESMDKEYPRLVIKTVGDPVWYLPSGGLGCTFNLFFCSLFNSADLICCIRKSIEKSSLQRYWWDTYHNT